MFSYWLSRGPRNFSDVCFPMPSGYTRIKDGDKIKIGKRKWHVRSGDGHAPGQLSSHYAPNAKLRMNAEKAYDDEYMIGFGDVVGQLNLSSQGDLTEAATNLFSFLHMADEDAITLGKTKIAVAPIPMNDLGIAINDRLKRASTPKD